MSSDHKDLGKMPDEPLAAIKVDDPFAYIMAMNPSLPRGVWRVIFNCFDLDELRLLAKQSNNEKDFLAKNPTAVLLINDLYQHEGEVRWAALNALMGNKVDLERNENAWLECKNKAAEEAVQKKLVWFIEHYYGFPPKPDEKEKKAEALPKLHPIHLPALIRIYCENEANHEIIKSVLSRWLRGFKTAKNYDHAKIFMQNGAPLTHVFAALHNVIYPADKSKFWDLFFEVIFVAFAEFPRKDEEFINLIKQNAPNHICPLLLNMIRDNKSGDFTNYIRTVRWVLMQYPDLMQDIVAQNDSLRLLELCASFGDGERFLERIVIHCAKAIEAHWENTNRLKTEFENLEAPNEEKLRATAIREGQLRAKYTAVMSLLLKFLATYPEFMSHEHIKKIALMDRNIFKLLVDNNIQWIYSPAGLAKAIQNDVPVEPILNKLKEQKVFNINELDENGQTVLFHALQNKNVRLAVRLIFDFGADIPPLKDAEKNAAYNALLSAKDIAAQFKNLSEEKSPLDVLKKSFAKGPKSIETDPLTNFIAELGEAKNVNHTIRNKIAEILKKEKFDQQDVGILGRLMIAAKINLPKLQIQPPPP
jgi:ankyrin repeat protein